MRKNKNQFKRFAIFGSMFLLSLVLWEFTSRTSRFFRYTISSPSLQVNYIRISLPKILESVKCTSAESAGGLLIAIVFSIAISALFFFKPRMAVYIYPILVFSQLVPFICLAPLIYYFFEDSMVGPMVLSTIMCFFPIVASLVLGIKSIKREFLDYMYLKNSSRKNILNNVIIPSCLPHFFSSLRVATPFSVIGAIVAEFNGTKAGIGKDIFMATKNFDPDKTICSLVFGAFIAGFIYSVVIALERKIGKWYLGGNKNEELS